MRNKIERRTCEWCGEKAEQEGLMIGGSMFNGWSRVEITDGSCSIPAPDCGPWDFCCNECCINFLEKTENSKTKMLTDDSITKVDIQEVRNAFYDHFGDNDCVPPAVMDLRRAQWLLILGALNDIIAKRKVT